MATRRTSQRITLVIALLASVTLLTLNYRGEGKNVITSVRNGARQVVAPVQRGISAVLHPIGDIFSGAVHYGSLQSQNEALQREIDKLQAQVAENGLASDQLQQILSQENLPFAGNIPAVLAQVIDDPTSNFDLTIEINRGTSEGVGVGMPVVTGAGLVGEVTSAGSGTAVVQLVTDARSSVGARFGKNEIAVVAGQGPTQPLVLQFVEAGERATKGEEVFTSGLLGATYPADIPIGTVSTVQLSPGAYTKEATVVPAVDFGNLQYVSVLQWLPPA